MSVYRKFESGDILSSVIHATPKIILTSGSIESGTVFHGWRGNIGESSSLSLYEGVRSRRDVSSGDFVTSGLSIFPIDDINTNSIDPVMSSSGSYPSTGSIQIVNVNRAEKQSHQNITSTKWYQEHFNPIELLYDYYSQINPDVFFMGSYDYYSLYFKQNAPYAARVVEYQGSGLPTVTSSFTMEAWIKPTTVVTGTQDFTIQSQRARWKFYITGSSGHLAFSDFTTTVTSSIALTAGLWQHVALTVDAGSASFYINSSLAGNAEYTGTLNAYDGSYLLTPSFMAVGAERVLSQSVDPGTGITSSFLLWDQGFQGFIFESRIWDVARSQMQISKNYNKTLSNSDSGSANLIHYSRFNDGPLGKRHGYAIGSGAFDYGRSGFSGQLQNYSMPIMTHTPIWQPNDNDKFITPKTKITDQIDTLKVVHVPSMFYGRQIAAGSVRLVCNMYDKQGISRVLCDDGRGGLYMSGSSVRSIGGDDYTGAKWNKVGNVFYVEGLIVITDPSLLDFGSDERMDWSEKSDILQVSFDGVSRIMTKVFTCRLGGTEGNASNNPTFSFVDKKVTDDTSDDRVTILGEDNTTYITSIGFYNEERKLVAVAKLAQPIRKREKDKIVIRPRIDF